MFTRRYPLSTWKDWWDCVHHMWVLVCVRALVFERFYLLFRTIFRFNETKNGETKGKRKRKPNRNNSSGNRSSASGNININPFEKLIYLNNNNNRMAVTPSKIVPPSKAHALGRREWERKEKNVTKTFWLYTQAFLSTKIGTPLKRKTRLSDAERCVYVLLFISFIEQISLVFHVLILHFVTKSISCDYQ